MIISNHALQMLFSLSLKLCIKLVACTTDRKDDFGIGLIVFELASQVYNVVVDCSRGRHVVGRVAPEVLQQILAQDHFATTLPEVFENLEFPCGKFQRNTALCGDEFLEVQVDVGKIDCIDRSELLCGPCLRLQVDSTEERFYAGQKFKD